MYFLYVFYNALVESGLDIYILKTVMNSYEQQRQQQNDIINVCIEYACYHFIE